MNKFMVALFNLNAEEDEQEFQTWMKENDIPVVSKLDSVTEYNLVKTVGMMGADGEPPYSHMEIIRVTDFDQLGKDAASAAVEKVAGQFQQKVKDAVWLFVDQIA